MSFWDIVSINTMLCLNEVFQWFNSNFSLLTWFMFVIFITIGLA